MTAGTRGHYPSGALGDASGFAARAANLARIGAGRRGTWSHGLVRRTLPFTLSFAALAAVLVGSLATPAVATGTDPSPAYDAAGRTVVRVRLHEAPGRLRVAREVRRGYDRDLFVHWISQGDGCDTRDRVLIGEARRDPAVSPDCALTGGRWFSYYDGVSTSDPATLDIDHMVPLAEAWDSGARHWSAGRRQRYANDLGDRRSLVAVTAASNRSKSDQDPREWLPDRARCRYLAEWVAVKLRWSLTVDRAEQRVLTRRVGSCADRRLRVRVVR